MFIVVSEESRGVSVTYGTAPFGGGFFVEWVDRRGDIPLVARHFVEQFDEALSIVQKHPKGLDGLDWFELDTSALEATRDADTSGYGHR